VVRRRARGGAPAALATLERAFEQGTFSVVASVLQAIFDPVRDEPRFRALMEKTGLVRRPQG
jgi:hypothetical protein